MKRYFIPKNFATEGMIFGRFKTRNVVEAVLFVGFSVFAVIKFVPAKGMIKFYIALVLIIVLGYLFVFGIHGRSVLQYLGDIISSNRTKKIYAAPKNADYLERKKRLIAKKHKTLKEQEKAKKKKEKEDRKLEKQEARTERRSYRKGRKNGDNEES